MSRRRKERVMENYKVFLRNCAGRNYQDSLDFCKNRVSTLEVTSPHHEMVLRALRIIDSGVGDPFGCMLDLVPIYEAKASVDLLVHEDVQAFKQDTYVAFKLFLLSRTEARWAYGQHAMGYFLPLLSDSPKLKEFLISQQDAISGYLDQQSYKGDYISPYLNRSVLLAISGDWEILKERSLRFLNDQKRVKSHVQLEFDFKFLLALANQDVAEMKGLLEGLLEARLSSRGVQDWDTFFGFYLCRPVLTYAKIAMIHGYDLGIDSPIAPKELIEIRPLASYEDPYDFMKEFDFDQPQQVWIDRWTAKMEAGLAWREKERKKLKNRILRFLRIGGEVEP